MTKERIPFHIRGYDEGEATSHPKDDGFADSVINIRHGCFVLRHLFGTTLFRKRDDNNDWTFFAHKRAPKAVHAQGRWLEDVLASRRFGRFLQWAPSYRHGYHKSHTCFLLLKNADDSVAYLNGRKFKVLKAYTKTDGDICKIAPSMAFALSESVFNNAVNPHLEDPYKTSESHKEEPIEFICGSQEALASTTRWICHTEPEMFGLDYEIQINYNSSSEIDEDDRKYYPNGVDDSTYSHLGQMKVSPRVRTLLDLAFEYNNFSGAFWEYNDMNGDRQSGYSRYPHSIEIAICVPSAHEQAKAWLQLDEWLEGKVPAAEKAALLKRGEVS